MVILISWRLKLLSTAQGTLDISRPGRLGQGLVSSYGSTETHSRGSAVWTEFLYSVLTHSVFPLPPALHPSSPVSSLSAFLSLCLHFTQLSCLSRKKTLNVIEVVKRVNTSGTFLVSSVGLTQTDHLPIHPLPTLGTHIRAVWTCRDGWQRMSSSCQVLGKLKLFLDGGALTPKLTKSVNSSACPVCGGCWQELTCLQMSHSCSICACQVSSADESGGRDMKTARSHMPGNRKGPLNCLCLSSVSLALLVPMPQLPLALWVLMQSNVLSFPWGWRVRSKKKEVQNSIP